MKKLLPLLLIITLSAYGQEKNDTKIIVTASDTTNLFNRVALLMIDQGYSFEQKDNELKFMRTTERSLKRYTASQKINISVRSSEVIITGLLRLDFSILGEKPTFDQVLYKRSSGNMNNVVWLDMVAIAKEIGGDIHYLK